MRFALCLLAFCVAPALAATAQETPRPLNYSAMNKLGWKLASQAYTFREMTLFETLDTLHKLGIRYVELFPGQRFSPENPQGFDSNASPEMIAELKAKLKADNVTPVSYGVTGFPADEAGARKVFEFAKTLGLLNITSEPGEDQLPMLDKLANEYKINIAIHNHPKGSSHYWDPDIVLNATKGLSHRIGACADTGHWYRSGLDPVECLKKLQGRIVQLHFKDLTSDKVDTPWGTGECNVNGMLAELKRQGFRGVFSIEYESTSGQELVDNVAKCVAAFSDDCAKLAK